MNSGELARLAGVSVRTLRHYHQIGVLPEPFRTTNGYRRYQIDDLVRLLRIKRLAALGIPLDRMPDLLDDTGRHLSKCPDRKPPELLEQLDRELAAEIERLTRQREIIAQIRAEGVAPDIPPELARFFAVFGTDGVSPALTENDRDQSILLAHLVGEQGRSQLAAFCELLASAVFAPRVATLVRRFTELTPDSDDDTIDALVGECVALFGAVVAELGGPAVLPVLDEKHLKLLDDYLDEQLNAAQQMFFTRAAVHFDADR
ncbi:MerR family transcriptional regulator [Micromonospora sp. NPDC003197]